MAKADMQTLLEAGVHFGHQTHRWNPKMKPFIFMKRNGIHIIDLAKTLTCLETARDAIAETVRRGDSVLFVCTKKQGRQIVEEEGVRCGQLYVTERWLGGTLTNLRTIRQSVRRLEEIEHMAEDGTYSLISKKERLELDRERQRLLKVLDGIREMRNLPGLIFIVDTHKEKIALKEANKLGIPIVGICDTNSDPERIDYPIPGNDDAIRSIRFFASYVADTVLDAKTTALEGREPVEPAAVSGSDGGEHSA
ncbi:MAG: 30S ribosomal protein S2 [Candidatus Eisenbacteria bacterium]|nr:30S ribosomal protein S2 [Candidatus Eisenbacteria bacterium]